MNTNIPPGKKEIILFECPDCQNMEQKITEVVKKPTFHKSGLYRCECEACGFVQTIKSKDPTNHDDYHN